MSTKSEGGAEQVLGAVLIIDHFPRGSFAIVLVEHRLGIEQVHMAGPAMHEELDYRLGLCRVCRRLGAQVVAAVTCAGLVVKQAAQGECAETTPQS